MNPVIQPLSEFHPRFNLFSLPFRIGNGVTFPLSASNSTALFCGRPDDAANLYVQKVVLTGTVATTFDVTNTWQVSLSALDVNGSSTAIVTNQTLWTASRSAGKNFTHLITVNTLYSTTGQAWYVGFTKSNTPGTLDIYTVTLWYNFV